MRTIGLLLALVSSLALAQGNTGQSTTGISRGNGLRIPEYKTTQAMSYFVDDALGSDANTCTASGASACATIQGAINKIPKLLQHGVTVTVAAGTYSGFFLSDFQCDPGVQQTTGGIMVDGFAAFTNSTLATGSATGTATASSAGSGTTFGTLTDAAQTWTVNDLVGRFVTAAGQTRVISSNTGTVITIVGTWTNPGTVAYTIQDPGVIIDTAITQPATPLAASSANGYAIQVSGNDCSMRNESMVIRGVRVSNTSGGGLFVSDTSLGLLTLSQIRNTNATSTNIDIGAAANASTGSGIGRWNVTDVDLLVPGSGNGLRVTRGFAVGTRFAARAGNVGTSLNSLSASASFSGVDWNGVTSPIQMLSGGAITGLSGSHITCAGAGTGITIGGLASAFPSAAVSSTVVVTGAVMATCGTGVSIHGPNVSADLTGLTGSAATTGILALNGGVVVYAATTTMTGGTDDINLDNGAATAALADITAGTCLATASFLSKVCAR